MKIERTVAYTVQKGGKELTLTPDDIRELLWTMAEQGTFRVLMPDGPESAHIDYEDGAIVAGPVDPPWETDQAERRNGTEAAR